MTYFRCPKCGMRIYSDKEKDELKCLNCGFLGWDKKDISVFNEDKKEYIG